METAAEVAAAAALKAASRAAHYGSANGAAVDLRVIPPVVTYPVITSAARFEEK